MTIVGRIAATRATRPGPALDPGEDVAGAVDAAPVGDEDLEAVPRVGLRVNAPQASMNPASSRQGMAIVT